MAMRRENVAAALKYLQDRADLRGRLQRATSLDPQEQDLADIAVETGASFIPGVGPAIAARDVERARRADDPAGMAMAAAGAIPGGKLAGLLKRYDPTRAEIFIGKTAKTYDPAAERRALEMEQAGIDRDTIWRETGTGRAFGPEWKQEISDKNAKLDFEFVPQTKNAHDWADQYLMEKGYKWIPGGIVGSPVISDELRREALNYGKEKAANAVITRPLNETFQHSELMRAYPEMFNTLEIGREPSSIVRGRYSQGVVTTGGGGLIGSNEIKPETSTLLHEIQHAIQEQEGFARGGNPEIARQALKQQFNQEMLPLQHDLHKRLEASSKSSMASRAQYAQKLKELQQKPNIRPREVFNMSDWYQYGTKVAEELGHRGLGWQMPRKKGPERDRWLQQAVKTMERLIQEKNPEMRGIENVMTPNQAKNAMAKTSRVFSETQDAAIKASRLQDKYSALQEKSDFDLYQRLAGEAESRAVQKRMDMTSGERRQTPPWQSLDIPEQEFIFRR
jgi:hypothetical protein